MSAPLRSHIFLDSQRCFGEKDKYDKLISLLKSNFNSKSLVYFQTRKQTEHVAELLKQVGFQSVIYHAGLTRRQKEGVESYIHESQKDGIVICATQALVWVWIFLEFVWFVFMVFLNNEDFYQMIGRAGRRGSLTWCFTVGWI